MSDVKSQARHRANGPAEVDARSTVGADGLTDHQRQKLRVRFRAGIGSRPSATAFRREADEMAEKLAGVARTVTR